MRCAALFGGRPERGAAGLANDVRRSHVLIGDSFDAVGRSLGPVCFFFWAVEAGTKVRRKPRPTTHTDRFVTNLAGMRPAQRLVSYRR